MRTLLVLTCVLAAALAADSLDLNNKSWVEYKKRTQRTFDNQAEELEHLKNFLQLQKVVGEINSKGQPGATAQPETRGFGSQLKGLYYDLHGRHTRSLNNHINSKKTLPASVDWREKNVVSPVQDQSNCGSGWAFAAAGAVEAQLAIKTGKLVPLSPQSLIDCSFNKRGCDGGSPILASAKPIQSLASYPYTGLAGTCKAGPTAAKSTDFVPIESGNENDLQDAIANIGPVTVAIDATDPLLQVYQKGVYAPKNCSSTILSHVALAVGYGQEDGQDYWLIKNSWGPEWGESGYLKLAKTGQNTCGIASRAGYLLA